MAPVVFGVNMGVHSPEEEKVIKKEIMKIPGTYYCARARVIICCIQVLYTCCH